MKERLGPPLIELYEPIWDLKRKREWADRVEKNLHRVIPYVPDLLRGCVGEFGAGSVEDCAMQACARFLEPMTEIFIAQLRMPTISGCSWVDVAPEASGKLLQEYEELTSSAGYARLEKASPLYAQIFGLLPKWAQLNERKQGNKMTDYSASMAAHLSQENLPVVLLSLGDAYTNHIEPDLRLIFPTVGPEFRKIERKLHEDVWHLAGRKRGFVYQPAIVGDLRFAAGSQWASLTVGEQLKRTAMLCPNMYKSMPLIRKITESSGLPFEEDFIRKILTQLYSSHEFAHEVNKNAPEMQFELQADMPSLACTFPFWYENLNLRQFEQAILATNAEYLSSLKDGLYGEAQWDAYYYSAASYFEDVLDSGLTSITGKSSFAIHSECLPRTVEFFSRRVHKPTLATKVPKVITPLLTL